MMCSRGGGRGGGVMGCIGGCVSVRYCEGMS